MPVNPAPFANAMNSSSLLSFPPGFVVIIRTSNWEMLFAADVIFGSNGRTPSTTITFPSLGTAS